MAPNILRPPYRSLNDLRLRMLQRMGFSVLSFGVDSMDWQAPDDTVGVVLSQLDKLPSSLVVVQQVDLCRYCRCVQFIADSTPSLRPTCLSIQLSNFFPTAHSSARQLLGYAADVRHTMLMLLVGRSSRTGSPKPDSQRFASSMLPSLLATASSRRRSAYTEVQTRCFTRIPATALLLGCQPHFLLPRWLAHPSLHSQRDPGYAGIPGCLLHCIRSLVW